MRHERGEAVVVAHPDLVGRHGVVLVHDGQHVEPEQALQRPLGVAVVGAADHVVGGEQHLADGLSVAGERARVGLGEQELADGRRGLLGGEVAGAAGQPERREPGRDRPRRDEHYLTTRGAALGERVDERVEPGRVETARQRGERRRPHLHDDPPRRGQRRAGHDATVSVAQGATQGTADLRPDNSVLLRGTSVAPPHIAVLARRRRRATPRRRPAARRVRRATPRPRPAARHHRRATPCRRPAAWHRGRAVRSRCRARLGVVGVPAHYSSSSASRPSASSASERCNRRCARAALRSAAPIRSLGSSRRSVPRPESSTATPAGVVGLPVERDVADGHRRNRVRARRGERVLDAEPVQPVAEIADGLVVVEGGLPDPALRACATHDEPAIELRVGLDREAASSTACGPQHDPRGLGDGLRCPHLVHRLAHGERELAQARVARRRDRVHRASRPGRDVVG